MKNMVPALLAAVAMLTATGCGDEDSDDSSGDASPDTDIDTDTDTDADGGSDGGSDTSCVVYVVGAAGSDTASGSSWEEGLATVEAGLDSAGLIGCDVWTKAGTYLPTEDPDGASTPADPRTVTFRLRSGVALYGGFAGDESTIDERDIVANETILSGDIGSINDNSDNAYHIVLGANNARIDGFTITAGNANGDYLNDRGGGMHNESFAPIVTNCVFSGNSADFSGGMYNGAFSATVTACVFSGNSAESGGGMFNDSSSPTVSNCTFSLNLANRYGSGMYNSDSSPSVTNCTFTGNSAGYNGGAISNFGDFSSPVVTNCVMWGDINVSGANEIHDFSYGGTPYPVVTESCIQGGHEGGGNIDAEPQFADAASGDLRFRPDSPCIDTGSNAAVPSGVTTDLDGNPRIVDGNGDSTATVDMGAYEFQAGADTDIDTDADTDSDTYDEPYEWHTFYGWSDAECASIVVDDSGALYVTGTSSAPWNGPDGEPPLHAYTGGDELFVLKLTAAGEYQWHTFFGGSASDAGGTIAVGGSSGLVVSGQSSSAWNGPGGEAPLHAHSGGDDLFVLAVDADGGFCWHTFYGPGSDWPALNRAIAVDGSGVIYVTGNFISAWNGPGGEAPLHAHSGGDDLFVLALNGDGAYEWHTFYGDSATRSSVVLSDGSGGLYVAGSSYATWNGPGGEAPLHAHSGGPDALLLKLDTAGAYQWHAFYGSSGDDYGVSAAVGASGTLYLAGHSSAAWNGPSSDPPLHMFSYGSDVFILALSGTGAYQWHTFYGSPVNYSDFQSAIAVDETGDLLVTGSAQGAWLGPGGEPPLHAYSGSGEADVFVLRLTEAGDYEWHSFYGSALGHDMSSSMDLGASGDLFVSGRSYASWDGPGGESPLHPFAAGSDDNVFVLSLAP